MLALKQHVKALIAKGAHTAAISAAADFARRNPRHPACYHLIAQAEEAAGYIKAAIQSVSQAIALAPHDPSFRIMRSRLYLKNQLLQPAIAELDTILAMDRTRDNAAFLEEALACREELSARLACSRPGMRPGVPSASQGVPG